MLAAGDPPDTALVDGYNMRTLVKRGGAVDVTQRMQRDGVKKEDYVDAWFDEFLYRGKYHYHPNMRGSTASFFYNKDLIERTGGKVPDRRLDAERLAGHQHAGDARRLLRHRAPRPVVALPVGQRRRADRRREERLRPRLPGGDQLAAVPAGPGAQEQGDPQLRPRTPRRLADLFVQGRLATVHGWFTDIPRYRQEIKDFTWDTVVMAQGKLRKQVGLYKGNGEVLLHGAKNPDGAWEFMKFLGGYDGMLHLRHRGALRPRPQEGQPGPAVPQEREGAR